jgi:chain length determinant protein tyrosine kinase EpsG
MNAFSPSQHSVSKMMDSEMADPAAPHPDGGERSIGEIISQANNLSPEQIEQVLAYQRDKGVRFGEAAIALGLASSDDVLWALAQQFHYPYSQDSTKGLVHSDLVVANRPFSDQAEAFRTMRSHLIMKMYSDPSQPRQALAVLSPDSGDGKSYFAANMAVAFSQLSGRTLLIDADMRNPRQQEIFGLQDKSSGLSSILSGRATSNVIHHIPQLPSLYVLPVGVVPPNPIELVERPAFGLLVRELMSKFDRVIVDTPAASLGADGAVIAAKCGAAVLLARRDHSSVTTMQNIVHTIGLANTRIVGSIMNEF